MEDTITRPEVAKKQFLSKVLTIAYSLRHKYSVKLCEDRYFKHISMRYFQHT